MTKRHDPQTVLDLWFPDTGHWVTEQSHGAFWQERMQGGMDAIICDRYADLTEAGARGFLDHWADTPRGRLALILVLDQFPRSLWRDTPGAYAQDIKAARLALDGLENGHYQALPHMWERQFYIISISHCEGPDHAARMQLCTDLSRAHAEIVPDVLADVVDRSVAQAERVQGIIARFGRHPHRNAILGRLSTPEEEAYIAQGDFPHIRKIEA